ncbi:MAG: YbaL family putative K(+) efflux transporter [Dongiaceae bacterium]
MAAHGSLIGTLVAGLGLAFVFGFVAGRLRLPPLVGYLVAGILIGPYTPGYVADQALASQLAEVGVVFLMFGVGLRFSFADLMEVRGIAIPGAVGQMALVAALGTSLGRLFGWTLAASMLFGAALSVASTVVVLRALQHRRLLDSDYGKIAIGWLVVQDVVAIMVLLVLPELPGAAGGQPAAAVWPALGLTAAKLAAFVAVMLLAGRRVIPWVLHHAAHGGSREVFRLAVLAVALGVAYGSAELFGVSFALGAFFAGMILAESTLSQQAATEILPFRDAFAVLFFVSVGMLFDPAILLTHPGPVLATFLVIVAGNAAAVFVVARIFRHSLHTALGLAASLSQIGEFSFVLASIGVALGVLPAEAGAFILAGALLSILANPLMFVAVDRLLPRLAERRTPEAAAPEAVAPLEAPGRSLSGHAVLVGYGRVGRRVGQMLRSRGVPLLVIEERQDIVEQLGREGVPAIAGNAGQPGMLEAANIAAARWLVSAIPNPFESGNLFEHGRLVNPQLEIVARAHSDAEVDYLKAHGANFIIEGEVEIARLIADHLVLRFDETLPAGAAQPA